MTLQELRAKRAAAISAARSILDAATDGVLTDEQQSQWDTHMAEAETLRATIERQERQEAADREMEERTPLQTVPVEGDPAETAPAVRVGTDRAERASMAQHTLRMLHGITTRQADVARDAQRELARAGHYGADVQQRAAGDYYSTLVDADGAILLPTVVADEIERIGNEYGFASRFADNFSHVVGTLKVPGATGAMTASAVAEGGAIASKMRAFKAVSLNPKKWAVIVPWTYEANLEAGPRILEDALFGIGLAFERAKDGAMFNGDGGSTYNSITGILAKAGTAAYDLAATKDSFDDITADDLILMRRQLPAAIRSQGAYAFHPDMEAKLRTLKDGNGSYIYAYNSDTGVATLAGRPVGYTEVLPAITADAEETAFGVFGAFRYWKVANGEGMSSEDLTQASVTDADTGTAINLATQDMRALKVRSFFDMGTNFAEAFCVISTGATS